MVRQAAKMTGRPFTSIERPFRWGEDFGEFTKLFGGAMFGLGAGAAQPDLHSPDYDFPGEILKHGIAMFAALVEIATAQPTS